MVRPATLQPAATGYDKLDFIFLGFIHLALIYDALHLL